jgi:hypothetical protein
MFRTQLTAEQNYCGIVTLHLLVSVVRNSQIMRYCSVRTGCVYGYKRSESQLIASGHGMESERSSKIGRQDHSKGDISGGPCARRQSVFRAC